MRASSNVSRENPVHAGLVGPVDRATRFALSAALIGQVLVTGDWVTAWQASLVLLGAWVGITSFCRMDPLYAFAGVDTTTGWGSPWRRLLRRERAPGGRRPVPSSLRTVGGGVRLTPIPFRRPSRSAGRDTGTDRKKAA